MDEWNVFSDGEEEGIEHKLGEPTKIEVLCECGDPVSSHDRLGCMRRGCDCTKTLATLTYQENR